MPSPIGHSLMGYCLYNDGSSLRRREWTKFVLFIFVANAPDLDFFAGVLNGRFGAYHREVTHSVVFAAVCAVAVYLAMKAMRRVYAGRVAQAVLIGLLSHLVLDYFCSPTPQDGIAALWPFSDARLSSPLQVFPGLNLHPLVGLENLRVVLVEMSALMIVLMLSSLGRTWSRVPRSRHGGRRAADSAGLDPAME